MVPSDDWGHIGARSRLDPLLSVFVDCVCEVTIFRHRRPTSGQRRSESKSQWPRGRRWPARFYLGERWPSRLVATAEAKRLSNNLIQLRRQLRRKAHFIIFSVGQFDTGMGFVLDGTQILAPSLGTASATVSEGTAATGPITHSFTGQFLTGGALVAPTSGAIAFTEAGGGIAGES
jgi:hypothetical protein